MRFESSADARSTTPCADIEDMVCWNKCTLRRAFHRPLGKKNTIEWRVCFTHSYYVGMCLNVTKADELKYTVFDV